MSDELLVKKNQVDWKKLWATINPHNHKTFARNRPDDLVLEILDREERIRQLADAYKTLAYQYNWLRLKTDWMGEV